MSNLLKDIFHKNYAPLCNYAAAIIIDKHAAEDVVQSVFIQLWENKKIFDLENPEVYLLKCVRYKSIDYLRRKKQKKEVFLQALPDIEKEEKSILKEEDILPLLNYFAAQLSPKVQRVFLLSRQHGMSYKEIAEELNVSVKTVENQMGVALRKLRILLKEHNYLPLLLLLFM